MAEHEKGKEFKDKFVIDMMNLLPTLTEPVMPTFRKFGDERSIFERDLAPLGEQAEQRMDTTKDAEDSRFKKMQLLNGNKFENGDRSQGDQEAEQRMVQNKATGLLQKFVGRIKENK